MAGLPASRAQGLGRPAIIGQRAKFRVDDAVGWTADEVAVAVRRADRGLGQPRARVVADEAVAEVGQA